MNEQLMSERERLTDAVKYEYEHGAYPGSKDWYHNQAIYAALEAFDAAHPEGVPRPYPAAQMSWDSINTI